MVSLYRKSEEQKVCSGGKHFSRVSSNRLLELFINCIRGPARVTSECHTGTTVAMQDELQHSYVQGVL